MSHRDLLTTLANLGRPKALVLGDLILDRYTFGAAERVSQEAPVILLRADRREARLGGAANVCHMLRGLEAEVTCAGVIGADADGAALRHMLTDGGVDAELVRRDAGRPTTVKERFIGRAANRHPHQILRVDHEVREPLSPALEDAFIGELTDRMREFQIVLISDYEKGVCTPRLLRGVIDAARACDVPVVVDPTRGADYTQYYGATTMTPNRLEAELATGVKIQQPSDAFEAGRRLLEIAGLQVAIVTLDCDGMAVVYADGRGQLFATRPRAVYDITGAGDMVLATIGLALGAGAALEDAVRLANVSGGLEVEQVGVAPISRDEIRHDLLHSSPLGVAKKIVTREQAAEVAAAARADGRRVVFTNGCFDLLHVGHVTYLEEAAAQGDLLILGLNSDASVSALKGPTRPVRKEHDRAAVLAALASVDYVVVFGERTPIKLIEAIRPDVLVKGGDYRDKLHEISEREFLESYGGQLYLAGLVEGFSTTNIVKSIAA